MTPSHEHAASGLDRSGPTPSSADRIDFSVVVPVYNEEACVEPLYREIVKAGDATGRTFEIVLVDDGSRDQTFAVARGLAREDPRLRVVRLRRNYGQSPATQAGFDHARGNVIVTMDGDLQNDPADIGRLLAEIDDGYDIVSGWRRDRQDDFISRKIPSMAANYIIKKITGVKIHDNGCALKAYRRGVIERTRIYADMHRFILVLTSMSGGSYREIVVNHRPRTLGRSKYGIGRTWKVLLDLITMVMITRFAMRPGLWFGSISLPFFVLMMISMVLAAIQVMGAPPDGETSIVYTGATLLLGFAFGNFLLLAFIGELVLRTGDYRETETVLVDVHQPEGVS